MITETLTYTTRWKYNNTQQISAHAATLIFIFGKRERLTEPKIYQEMRTLYPNADIVGCSSGGNILGNQLHHANVVATVIQLDKGSVQLGIKDFTTEDDLVKTSEELVNQLPREGLKHIFLLSDGLNMNGSSLTKGVNRALNHSLPVTGALAGDGMLFEETLVIANDVAQKNRVVAIGFYGEGLHISSGCYAGWNEFGIYRRITKSVGNVVYEIDHQPALHLYKKYLGEYANALPQSGLRFPFSVKKSMNAKDAVIRSVMAINEEDHSLTFAGDVKEGAYARLMKTDIDGLIDGSEMAACQIKQSNTKNALGLVVSCVGRRALLNQLTDEEIEVIGEVLGDNVQLIGFYSYGELAPHSDEIVSCQLHNQTMTLTVIYEE